MPSSKSKKVKARSNILCKVRDHRDRDCDYYIIYRDGTWRWSSERKVPHDDLARWKLAHSDFGPMFLYNHNGSEWRTDWSSENEDEVYLANAIAKALTDLEMEKVLKE